jgi:Na+-driven multidrug efflux pump
VRDEGHHWRAGNDKLHYCTNCRKSEPHVWDGCKCKVCGATTHTFGDDGFCIHCGQGKVVGRYAGKRTELRLEHCSRCGMTFAGICIVTYEIFAESIVGLFIKDAQTLNMGINFLRICCIATPLMICNVQMSYTFQAMGKGPQSLLLSSCRQGLVNIPLLFLMNALFGLYGVVWTQLLADGITLIISFTLYQKLYNTLKSHYGELISVSN